jgi:hypothetical protein
MLHAPIPLLLVLVMYGGVGVLAVLIGWLLAAQTSTSRILAAVLIAVTFIATFQVNRRVSQWGILEDAARCIPYAAAISDVLIALANLALAAASGMTYLVCRRRSIGRLVQHPREFR